VRGSGAGLPNDSALLFRWGFYKNGGHAGYVFYATEAIRRAMEQVH